MTERSAEKARRRGRRPNAPYLKIDVLGRLVINVYRTGQHRHDGPNPIVQIVDERGTFDTLRGVFIHVGHVGAFVAINGNGPGYYKEQRRG